MQIGHAVTLDFTSEDMEKKNSWKIMSQIWHSVQIVLFIPNTQSVWFKCFLKRENE